MTLGELRTWVLRTVKRATLINEGTDAINAAIEYATTFGDFAWDLQEGTQALDATAYTQSISISAVFTRFRKMKYMRPAGYRKYLTWRDPSRIFDKDGCEIIDTWYRAGDNIIFKLSNLQSSLLYGFYSYPARLSAVTDSCYLTVQCAAAIHDLAASRLWEDMGNEAEAQRFERRAIRLLQQHRSDKADSVSHS